MVLYNRLSKIIEPEIGNYQMGFRPNSSTLGNIFVVRQIYEKCYEYNIDLHSVHRDVIYNSLIKQNVPDKLIKLIKLNNATNQNEGEN